MNPARELDRVLGHASHGCGVCRSDCTEVDRLRALVVALEGECFRLAYALREAQELRDFARAGIEARFPIERTTQP
jgi:hypothetical protein